MDITNANVRIVATEDMNLFDEIFELNNFDGLYDFDQELSSMYNGEVTVYDYQDLPDTLITKDKNKYVVPIDVFILLKQDYAQTLANFIELYGQVSVKQAMFDLGEKLTKCFSEYMLDNDTLFQEIVERFSNGENTNIYQFNSFYTSEFLEYLSEYLGIEIEEEFDEKFESFSECIDDALNEWWYYNESNYTYDEEDYY